MYHLPGERVSNNSVGSLMIMELAVEKGMQAAKL
jgi:hypothetical protein